MNARIIFMGTPVFASVVLERLVRTGYKVVLCITQPDKPSGRKMIMTPPPVKETAESSGIPVFQPQRLREPLVEDQIRAFRPDLIVTAAYGKILPASILNIPEKGCLNVHGSLLPQYRGAAPIQWSILNGDTRTGVTIMKMDEGMDTGPVLRFAVCPIGADENAGTLTQKLALLGAELLAETIPGYLDGSITPIAQKESGVTYAPPIMKEQGEIKWNNTAESIHNQIRGLSEWPGAYSEYRGKRIKIYCSLLPKDPDRLIREYPPGEEKPLPGTVICARKEVLAVMCKDSPLLLTCIQPESCRKMQSAECAHNFAVSDRFGDSL